MASNVKGASRFDGFKFTGPEIEALEESPQLVRWGGLDNEHVVFLAADMAARGQQSPVLIRTNKGGKPELIAGRHRKAAILLINEDPSQYGLPAPMPLLAVKKDYDDEEAIRASFYENTGKPLSCMDLAQAATQLSNVLDLENAKIAEMLTTPHQKVSTSRVSQLKSLMRLPVSIQRRLHKGTLKESVARAMLRLDLSADEMKDLAKQLDDGDIKPSEITARANEKRRGEGKKIKRGLSELRAKLEEIGTSAATDLLSWIDGEKVPEKRLTQILKD